MLARHVHKQGSEPYYLSMFHGDVGVTVTDP